VPQRMPPGLSVSPTTTPTPSRTPPPRERCIAHAKANDDRTYLGRKPSYTPEQFNKVHAMLGEQTVAIAQIAKETGLTRQTIYRIKDDPAGAEAALVACEL